MNLTRNFTLQEMIKSDTAIRKGIDNNPNADHRKRKKMAIKTCFNEDQFGRVKVTSGL